MEILIGSKKTVNERVVPLVPLRDTVIFPHTHIPLTFGRPKSNAAVSASVKANKLICFVAQKQSQIELPDSKDFYGIGTLASIEQVIPADGSIHALVHGLARVQIKKLFPASHFLSPKW